MGVRWGVAGGRGIYGVFHARPRARGVLFRPWSCIINFLNQPASCGGCPAEGGVGGKRPCTPLSGYSTVHSRFGSGGCQSARHQSWAAVRRRAAQKCPPRLAVTVGAPATTVAHTAPRGSSQTNPTTDRIGGQWQGAATRVKRPAAAAGWYAKANGAGHPGGRGGGEGGGSDTGGWQQPPPGRGGVRDRSGPPTGALNRQKPPWPRRVRGRLAVAAEGDAGGRQRPAAGKTAGSLAGGATASWAGLNNGLESKKR